jgi:hypothetical protein
MSDEYDAIHEAVRLDPETVWRRVRDFLCSSDDAYERIDLIEDLMFWHSDSFIDRLEALAGECPQAREPLEAAHVGGRAETPGLTRFYALQDRLRARPTD